MDILFGILALGLGFLLCFSGYQFARILIPLWGLFAGFSIGAGAVANATGEGFVSTTLGIIVGVVIGLIFALFAYFFFSLAVVLLGASVGYWAGVQFMGIFGLDDGFLAALLGIVLGTLFAIIAIVFNLPKIFLITVTAIGGALAVVGGLMLVFNQIDASAFSLNEVRDAVESSWIWVTGTIVLAVMGLLTQLRVSRDMELEAWSYVRSVEKSNDTPQT